MHWQILVYKTSLEKDILEICFLKRPMNQKDNLILPWNWNQQVRSPCDLRRVQ